MTRHDIYERRRLLIDYDVFGAKDIAELLGYESTRQIYRLARRKVDPLPVKRQRGEGRDGRRLVAKSQALRSWLARQVEDVEADPRPPKRGAR